MRNKEYIEKEALLAQVRESRVNNPHLDSRDRHAHDTEHRHFEYMIFSAKPADVAPVVRGEWIRVPANELEISRGYIFVNKCSRCGHRHTPENDNFCLNCGADMREEVNDERL